MTKENFNSIVEISELIARDISGQLSQLEKESLQNWIDSSARNRQMYLRIINGNNLSARNSLYESVDTGQAWIKVSKILAVQHRRRVVSLLLRYAAAIMIPVILGITGYWYLNEKPQKEIPSVAEILPGTSNAVLVLANGENVNLSKDSTRNLIENDGTVIKNANKELSYAEQLSKNTKQTLLNALIVPQGGEYTLILSDGTRVFVNSMSKLVFPVSFKGNKREITLEGEAYFEVAKDKLKPFIVTIKGMQVEVLGTSFNIKAYPNDNQSFTTLLEGSVKLNSGFQSSKVSILEPDQQAVYDPETAGIVVQKVDAAQFVQWTTGKYFFTNQTLDEIMKTLARWYDFNYKYDDEALKMIRFEGGLNKYESIDPILDIINKTGKLRVSVKGKDILFLRN
jgi:transmembrane sensor